MGNGEQQRAEIEIMIVPEYLEAESYSITVETLPQIEITSTEQQKEIEFVPIYQPKRHIQRR